MNDQRIAWLAQRNAQLTRHTGGLEDQLNHTIKVLARVALVAGNGHPSVAREIVAIAETEPKQTIDKVLLLDLLGGP